MQNPDPQTTNHYCSQCEAPVPKGQHICSMCMGDIDHGKDNYYRDLVEKEKQDKEYHELAIVRGWYGDMDQ